MLIDWTNWIDQQHSPVVHPAWMYSERVLALPLFWRGRQDSQHDFVT
jgi:hypothetical protein